uniref:Uncharacterized protein n=1 Tax=Anguilla anguilla TaxID=7936 RepID=A0A0E9W7I5_ANGAN
MAGLRPDLKRGRVCHTSRECWEGSSSLQIQSSESKCVAVRYLSVYPNNLPNLSAGGRESHDAAPALEEMGVFVAQSLFGSVLLQVCQLFAVDSPPALLPDELNGVLILHSAFDQR